MLYYRTIHEGQVVRGEVDADDKKAAIKAVEDRHPGSVMTEISLFNMFAPYAVTPQDTDVTIRAKLAWMEQYVSEIWPSRQRRIIRNMQNVKAGKTVSRFKVLVVIVMTHLPLIALAMVFSMVGFMAGLLLAIPMFIGQLVFWISGCYEMSDYATAVNLLELRRKGDKSRCA